MSNHPMLDDDGYPTEETLKRIREWDVKSLHEYNEMMKFVESCWAYHKFGWHQSEGKDELQDKYLVIRYEISTAGWSGNESLIEAMEENVMFWAMCWIQSRRGGHYIFEVRTVSDDVIREENMKAIGRANSPREA